MNMARRSMSLLTPGAILYRDVKSKDLNKKGNEESVAKLSSIVFTKPPREGGAANAPLFIGRSLVAHSLGLPRLSRIVRFPKRVMLLKSELEAVTH